MGKKFNKDLFLAHDAVARAGGLMHLCTQGAVISCWPNEKRYDADLVYTFTPNGTTAFLEAEIKTVWHGGAFPYPEVQVLGRKKKYFVQGIDMIMIAANHEDYLIIPHTAILASPTKSVRNRFNFAGEDMYIVDLLKVYQKKFPRKIDVKEVFCCGDIVLERLTSNQFKCKACERIHNYVE